MHQQVCYKSHKHLGITLSCDLSWREHITNIADRANKRVNILAKLKHTLDRKTLVILYTSFIRPMLEYADIVWCNMSKNESDLLESVQRRAGRIISGAILRTPTSVIYEELAWSPLETRRNIHKLILFYKMVNRQAPAYLVELVPSIRLLNEQLTGTLYETRRISPRYLVQGTTYNYHFSHPVLGNGTHYNLEYSQVKAYLYSNPDYPTPYLSLISYIVMGRESSKLFMQDCE